MPSNPNPTQFLLLSFNPHLSDQLHPDYFYTTNKNKNKQFMYMMPFTAWGFFVDNKFINECGFYL